jgi:hypothetical protein
VPRPATFTDLLHKPVRSKALTIKVPESEEDNAEIVELTVRVRARGQKAYDDLLAAHPPTKKQKDQGDVYNVETFCPALLSECVVEPKISMEEATELWTSDTWSRGELSELFFACVDVNSKGLDIPFT